jgi:hypothetical protein
MYIPDFDSGITANITTSFVLFNSIINDSLETITKTTIHCKNIQFYIILIHPSASRPSPDTHFTRTYKVARNRPRRTHGVSGGIAQLFLNLGTRRG